MRINSNIIALSVQTAMRRTSLSYAKNSLMLSSGLKINSVKDDASGLAIGNKLDRQVRGYEKVSNNAGDGISLIQTLDGALDSVGEMLRKVRTLSIQSANDTLEDEDRRKMQEEVQQLKNEISELSERTEFNGIKLLDGDGKRLTFDRSAVQGGSSVNYVSGSVPQGMLEFTVNSVGTAPQVAFNPNGITAGTAGTLEINGSTLKFTGQETEAEILEQIKTACEDNNIDLDIANGIAKSKVEGSKSTITITSTPNGAFGFNTSSSTGVDAVISGVTLKDIDTNVNIDSFNNGISNDIRVDGNRAYIVSTNGQEIEIDIKSAGAQKHEIRNEGQIKLQIGTKKDMELDLYVREIDTTTLGIEHVNISTSAGAQSAITAMDEAIDKILEQRTYLGAAQNRLQFTEKSIDTASLNTQQAYSRIMDVDMAKVMSEFSRDNVKYQAATSILAQANQRPQQILQLLG